MKLQKECKMATGKGRLIALLFGLMGTLHALAANEVWVSDARGNDATGAGTYEQPYKTIQKGVTKPISIANTPLKSRTRILAKPNRKAGISATKP